ncbi:MAG TPA: hypothetical protein VFV38_19655 [Ktedonobacteraceae bacterium]|nr:hypothetical protein [Ktedonobacteraceae bacterium]
MNSHKLRPEPRNFAPIFLALLVFAVLGVIAIPFYVGRMMMGGSPPQTAQQFTLASPGTTMNVALQVTSLPGATLFAGTLLQRNADASYSQTSQSVSVRWNPAQSVTMGNSSDIKVGALLQVHGTLDARNLLIADQIVVLTNFIHIKAQVGAQ